jgi:hypothetical protein
MRTRSFEEKQLSQKLFEIENVSAEISIELDIIFKELDRKGKWNEFMSNLDSIKPKKKFSMADVSPENYYESLHFAFDIMSKSEDLRDEVEASAMEADLLRGKGMEEIDMPSGMMQMLNESGIYIQAGRSDATPIRNEKYTDRVCLYNLKSKRILRLMEKALNVLKDSKTYIFLKF